MEIETDNTEREPSGIKRKAIVVFTASFALIMLVLFLSAGSLLYWQAWVFSVVFFIPVMFVMVYFLLMNPEFIERRLRYREKESGQRKIMKYGKLFFAIGFLIPGFDYRFQWSAVPPVLVILSDVIVFMSYLIVFFVFKENAYASRVVEVEKQQRVITTGPYSIVRHPMYTGVMIMYLFIPLALGSYWALIPFGAVIPVIILRALNEEKVLLRDLTGYGDYCVKIKYRLIPYVW